MRSMKRVIAAISLGTVLVAGLPGPAAARGFNDQYVFATTKSVNQMDANPALKVTLFPVTVVLDTVFLPFAVVAGYVS